MKKLLKGIKKGMKAIKENLFECVMATGLLTVLGMVIYIDIAFVIIPNM